MVEVDGRSGGLSTEKTDFRDDAGTHTQQGGVVAARDGKHGRVLYSGADDVWHRAVPKSAVEACGVGKQFLRHRVQRAVVVGHLVGRQVEQTGHIVAAVLADSLLRLVYRCLDPFVAQHGEVVTCDEEGGHHHNCVCSGGDCYTPCLACVVDTCGQGEQQERKRENQHRELKHGVDGHRIDISDDGRQQSHGQHCRHQGDVAAECLGTENQCVGNQRHNDGQKRVVVEVAQVFRSEGGCRLAQPSTDAFQFKQLVESDGQVRQEEQHGNDAGRKVGQEMPLTDEE